MCTAGGADRPRLSVIEGRAEARPRIALSLVHPRERIDIPVKDVLEIEALADQTFFFPEIQAFKSYECANVRLSFSPEIGRRIYRLTSGIVGEPLDCVVDGDVICSPVVREPLGVSESFSLRVHDFAVAQEIAAKIHKGWVIPDLRIVRE